MIEYSEISYNLYVLLATACNDSGFKIIEILEGLDSYSY